MNIGMLWFDNDPKASLGEKVLRAARYYRDKYRREATVCYVHPSMIPAGTVGRLMVEAIEVRARREILPMHLWIGIEMAQAVGS